MRSISECGRYKLGDIVKSICGGLERTFKVIGFREACPRYGGGGTIVEELGIIKEKPKAKPRAKAKAILKEASDAQTCL